MFRSRRAYVRDDSERKWDNALPLRDIYGESKFTAETGRLSDGSACPLSRVTFSGPDSPCASIHCVLFVSTSLNIQAFGWIVGGDGRIICDSNFLEPLQIPFNLLVLFELLAAWDTQMEGRRRPIVQRAIALRALCEQF